MAIIHFLPKLTKAVPSGLVAIAFVTLIVLFVPGLEDTRTVASYLAENGYKELL
jgi:sulfate permease, SulP family